MLKRLIAVSVCALMAACGSSDSSKGNAAAGTTFTYGGTSSPVTNESSAAISDQMQNMVTTSGAPTAANAESFKSFSGVSDSLLGENPYSEYGSGKMIPGSPSAARDLVFKLISKQKSASSQAFDPSCYAETETSVTFNNCTDTESSEGMTFTMTIDGSLSVTGTYTLAWNFTVSIAVTGTATATAVFATSGSITLTELTGTTGTIVGSEIASLDVTATGDGQTVRIAVSESLNLDVQYDTSCEYFVVDGTLEAKRVWTALPQGATGDEFDDIAVKVTWTGCGAGTFQYGTK